MKLTKLLLVLTAFTSLVVFSDTAARAASKDSTFTVTTSVKNNCTISTVNIVFPDYDPITGTAVTANGTVTVACTKGAPGLVIDLDDGLYPSSPDNQMANGTERLKYGLFVDSGFATRWNGTSWNMPAPTSKAAQDFTIYGQIGANQDVAVGDYSDTVVATINY